LRYGDKNEHSFVTDRHGNRIMAQTKCKGDHTGTHHSKHTKGMPGNLLGPTGMPRDTAKTPGD